MTGLAALIILLTTLVTSFISGIFGMAGGLVLMGVLIALVSVPMAMILHGSIQLVANGYRSFLLSEHINWPSVGYYSLGALAGTVALLGLLMTVLTGEIDKSLVYLILGFAPLLIWIPKDRLHLDIQRPTHAIIAGFSTQAMNTLAGVAGPLLDLFFVRASLSRQGIVATKSVTQAISHSVKVAFWITSILLATNASQTPIDWPPIWLIPAAIPLSIIGTRLGKMILERMTDTNFRAWMKGLVTVIGVVYILRAFGVF